MVEEKLAAARDDLADREGVLVAFSGGLDSSVVAAIAHDALGVDAVACTAQSETLPAAELSAARETAEEIGIRHEVVQFSELNSDAFVRNGDDRCYHCRSMRLSVLQDRARDLGLPVVCDGTTASEAGQQDRPDLRAVDEFGVNSPLRKHGISKDEAREIARKYDLSVAEKPSMDCLSSRIPTGEKITEERLSRIETAERLLDTWGFEQYRVRDHDGVARIEVAEPELDAALDADFVQTIRDHVAELGFDHVTLDLHGFRSDSVTSGSAADETGATDSPASVD